VFETQMAGFEHLGSICSGGRYDALADDGRNRYPGVGISLGVSRVLVPLIARGQLTASRSVPSAVLVALVDEGSRPDSNAIAQSLRARGIAAEVAATAQKFGKQIRYAERRGIPYVWFPAGLESAHQVKDIRDGGQRDADPSTWSPPDADMTPAINTTAGGEAQ
jgi:histidyl-tRNA synthetase